MKMGDIEESQVSMVIDDEDVDSDIQYDSLEFFII
jgi:hypothetical protein